MNKARGSLIYLLSVAGATLVAFSLRTVALFLDFDEIGYFGGGFLSVFLSILQALVLIGCVAFPLSIKKGQLSDEQAPLSPVGKVCTALAALLTAFTALALVIRIKSFLPSQRLLLLAAVIALLVGAAYFVMQLMGKRGAFALLSFGVILGAIFLISLTYFDLYTPMNAPRKTSLHLCLLSIMLYMLYELRMAVSRPMPRALSAMTCVCFFLTVSMGGSNLIFSLHAGHDLLYILGDVFSLAIGLYAAGRTADTLLAPEAAVSAALSEESAEQEPKDEEDCDA